jgi:hypothetical protein
MDFQGNEEMAFVVDEVNGIIQEVAKLTIVN